MTRCRYFTCLSRTQVDFLAFSWALAQQTVSQQLLGHISHKQTVTEAWPWPMARASLISTMPTPIQRAGLYSYQGSRARQVISSGQPASLTLIWDKKSSWTPLFSLRLSTTCSSEGPAKRVSSDKMCHPEYSTLGPPTKILLIRIYTQSASKQWLLQLSSCSCKVIIQVQQHMTLFLQRLAGRLLSSINLFCKDIPTKIGLQGQYLSLALSSFLVLTMLTYLKIQQRWIVLHIDSKLCLVQIQPSLVKPFRLQPLSQIPSYLQAQSLYYQGHYSQHWVWLLPF